MPVLSETDNSDLEGTPNPTKKTPHHPPNHSTTNTPVSQDTEQLETHDRMSKEKQKFFRTSAFNAEKKKVKEKKEQSKKNNTKDKVSKENEKIANKKVESDRRTRSTDTPASKKVTSKTKNSNVCSETIKKETNTSQNTRSQQKNNAMKNTSAVKNKSVAEVVEKIKEEEEEGTSSEESTSSSSCSSESDTDSSVDNSDSKASIRNIKIPQIFNITNVKQEPTFGSISGISVDKDAPWGFAAAAAEAKSKDTSNKPKCTENLFISVLKEEGLLKDNTDTYSSQDEEKSSSEMDKNQKSAPGYGQLKGLFDGLSHLFTAPTESRASRSQPNYNPNRRKPKDEETKEIKEEKKDEKIKVEPVKVEKEKVEKEKVEKIENKPPTKSPSTLTTTSTSTTTIPNIPKMKSLSSQIPNSPKPVVPKDEVASSMTPSGLVKTAVNSKQHERRKLIKSEANDAQQKCNNDAIDARIAKKRNHVTAGQVVAATNQPMSATLPFTTNNQTGKIGYPHLPLHNDHNHRVSHSPTSHDYPFYLFRLFYIITRVYPFCFFTCA